VSRPRSWSSPASPCLPLSVNGVTGRLDEDSALVGSQRVAEGSNDWISCASAMTCGMTSLPSGTKPLTMRRDCPMDLQCRNGLDLGAHLFDSPSERFSLGE
jgi:hypothetical protein